MKSNEMEFIDEIATQITEMNFKEKTYSQDKDRNNEIMFTNEAQDYYNEMYDEYEGLTNNLLGVYSNNELNK